MIDAGLAKIARFDPYRGINTLLVEKISRASAEQRAGRAGRTAPGVCLRLWTEREHGDRAPQELPEVRRLDLAEVVLTLKASGVDDVAKFRWLESPDPQARLSAPRRSTRRAREAIEYAHPRLPHHPHRPPDARLPRAPALRANAARRRTISDVCPRCALVAALTQGRNMLRRVEGKQMKQIATRTRRKRGFGFFRA